jgi:hypothetical protein
MVFEQLKKILTKKWISRADRIKVAEFHDIVLKLKGPSQLEYQLFKVVNVSTTGMAVDLKNTSHDFTSGDLLKARITIKDKMLDVSVKIVFVGPELMGVQVQGPPPDYISQVINYFKTELSAIKSNPISKDHLKPDTDGEPHWYYGGDNFELYFVVNDDKVCKFKLVVWGDIIEMNKDGQIFVGHSWDQTATREFRMFKESVLVGQAATNRIPKETLEHCRRFVHSIPNLKVNFRDQIISGLDQVAENNAN